MDNEGKSTAVDQSVPTEVDPPLAERPTAIDRPRRDSVEPRSRAASRVTLPPTAITTAAEAMRDEEVHRTRVFIRLGWAASIVGLGAIPFVDADRYVTIAYIAALVIGMIVSFGYHQAFRDPRRYTPRALLVLGVMSTFNTHVAVLFFGAFTLTPVLIVIGLHFIGRSELSARRAVLVTSCACHGTIAAVLIVGRFHDPGVFATARPLGVTAYLIGAAYVQAAYALAYVTGRSHRRVSLRSIEQLQRATKVASQRAALLDELRADLERAQHGGMGRYSGQICGEYRLGTIIGRGAHGEVYEARHVDRDEPAAVKVLRREHLTDTTALARFLRETRATGAIDSPHVVRVLDTSAAEAPIPFLVMERLSGMTLADLLRRAPVLPTADVLRLVTDVGAAIDVARGAGIVHRDLKPPNLFLAGSTWKVLDYGVAALGDTSGTLTRGDIVGTPHYMAPEQARGERVDHRADLYALGAITYRALTGRNPFGGADTPSILYAVIHTMPQAPSALAELPIDLDRWMLLALAKDPAARWSSGAELARTLGLALAGTLDEASRTAADQLLARTPWRGGS